MTHLVLSQESSESFSIQELRTNLEQGDDEVRVAAMKQVITALSSGEDCSSLLMHVIRNILPQGKNKTLKKLMLLFFEMVPKTDAEGKLKQEMILVCNALRNDLQHPNEYVRGCTLRFLCKIVEQEIISPLVPSIQQCLEHKHSYVRKYAVSTVAHVFRHFPHLIPDAGALINTRFARDNDNSVKKMAFLALTEVDIEMARALFRSLNDDMISYDSELQLAILEFIRKDSKINFNDKGYYVKCVVAFLESKSNAVKFASANLLVHLSSSPNAIKVAVGCFVELAAKENDLNSKLVLLERIKSINESNPNVCTDLALDILKVLSSNEIQVKKQCVSIVLSLVSSKHLEEVVLFLRKDLLKFCKMSHVKEGIDEYIDFLLDSLNFCLKNNSDFIAKLLPVFIELLMQREAFEGISLSDSISLKAIHILRDVLIRDESFRKEIFEGILSVTEYLSPNLFKDAVWILGEFSRDEDEVILFYEKIKSLVGELPLIAAEVKYLQSSSLQSSELPSQHTKILPDGTYATETAISTQKSSSSYSNLKKLKKRPLIRQFLVDGKYQIALAISNAFAKSKSRLSFINDKFLAQFALILISFARFGLSQYVNVKIDSESYDRIIFDIELLCSKTGQKLIETYLNPSVKKPIIVKTDQFQKPRNIAEKRTEVDDKIDFRMLKSLASSSLANQEDEFEKSLRLALGSISDINKSINSNLSKITQFTGYSDAIYAEAYVTVSQFDIHMDVLIVNQTKELIRNLSFELTTLGDLKLNQRPKPINLPPYGFQTIKASLRVSSTENAVIFGNIVYEKQGSCDGKIISLNDVKIDVVDYIQPAQCSQSEFNKMYLKFEWENKIALKANARSLYDYLIFLLSKTHFSCINPSVESFKDPSCPYLSACLFAKSIFGEEVVANVSLEMNHSTSTVTGHLRLRAKSTGIAYSLGEKVSLLENISLV